MKKSILLFILFILLFANCAKKKINIYEKEINKRNKELKKTLNSNINNIDNFYFKDPIIFYEANTHISKQKDFLDLYEKLFKNNKLKKIEIIHREPSGFNFYYEIGTYIFSEKKYTYLCKWIRKSNTWKKEFEAISENNTNNNNFEGINKAKEKWIEVSSKKDNTKTVTSMYLKNGYYYSHNKLQQGHENIIKAYYPNLQFLKLEEKSIIKVKENLIYEIGKYKVHMASGIYILIWVKHNNEWQVYLDSDE